MLKIMNIQKEFGKEFGIKSLGEYHDLYVQRDLCIFIISQHI